MDLLERFAIVASLLDSLKERGNWCGETHLQKAVFFLQTLLSVPLRYEFVLYKHGPFSFDLRDELGELRAYGLLAIKPQPAPYGPSIEVAHLGRSTAQKLDSFTSQFQRSIDFVAIKLGERGVAELERLATALYVDNDMGPRVSIHEKAQKVSRLKPHVSTRDAEAAVAAVEEMRLVLASS